MAGTGEFHEFFLTYSLYWQIRIIRIENLWTLKRHEKTKVVARSDTEGGDIIF